MDLSGERRLPLPLVVAFFSEGKSNKVQGKGNVLTMNIRRMLLANALNLVLFGLILFSKKFIPLPLVVVLGIGWLGFLVYSNYTLFFGTRDSNDMEYELDKANRNFFNSEVAITKIQMKSIEDRAEVFQEFKDDHVKDLYSKVREQFYTNVKYIIRYMDSYDYVTKPQSQKDKIDNLVKQNDILISKLNGLVEEMIAVDKTAYDLDISIVDDLLDSLKVMSEQGPSNF